MKTNFRTLMKIHPQVELKAKKISDRAAPEAFNSLLMNSHLESKRRNQASGSPDQAKTGQKEARGETAGAGQNLHIKIRLANKFLLADRSEGRSGRRRQRR